jgi:hypothetical protein
MGGQRAAGNRSVLRAVALLLALAVAFGATGLARTGHPHKAAVRVAAVLAHKLIGTQHGGLDADRAAAPTSSPARSVADATRDSSAPVSARTAQTPQVRGPPGQGRV